MLTKAIEKERAIELRKRGFSYSEVLKEVPVAKSTLSLWLREIGLSKKQKQRLTEKKLLSALWGAEKRKQTRIDITQEIKNKAKREISNLTKRDLFMIGIALYWAEGHKEKDRGSLVRFGNSDSKMIRIFLKWLREVCEIDNKDISFRIYLHEVAERKLDEVKQYWANVTRFPKESFQKVTWKRNKINTNRKNKGENYYGLLSVYVKNSVNLNRKIQGWIEGICNNCGVVQW
jgi:hypothetical protein